MAGDESVGGAPCWKIQSTPKEAKSSQYSKSIVWVRKDNYVFARFENYVGTQIVRRLDYSDIRNDQGIWTAHTAEMSDLRRGSRTKLTRSSLIDSSRGAITSAACPVSRARRREVSRITSPSSRGPPE